MPVTYFAQASSWVCVERASVWEHGARRRHTRLLRRRQRDVLRPHLARLRAGARRRRHRFGGVRGLREARGGAMARVMDTKPRQGNNQLGAARATHRWGARDALENARRGGACRAARRDPYGSAGRTRRCWLGLVLGLLPTATAAEHARRRLRWRSCACTTRYASSTCSGRSPSWRRATRRLVTHRGWQARWTASDTCSATSCALKLRLGAPACPVMWPESMGTMGGR